MNTRPLISLLVVVLLFCAAAVFLQFGKVSPKTAMYRKVAEPITQDIDLYKIENGLFKGSFTYAKVTVAVEVTVKDLEIAAIKILGEPRNEYEAKARGVAQRILSAQTPAVDAIAGATISSRAIQKAVRNALESGVRY